MARAKHDGLLFPNEGGGVLPKQTAENQAKDSICSVRFMKAMSSTNSKQAADWWQETAFDKE